MGNDPSCCTSVAKENETAKIKVREAYVGFRTAVTAQTAPKSRKGASRIPLRLQKFPQRNTEERSVHTRKRNMCSDNKV